MAVREYIGARYVPLFADPLEWDNQRTYEPLTIVLYQGASYTSRQAVPKNIDILNNEYWALTGNYNAQVEQYRAEVRTYDGRITTAQETAEAAQVTAEGAQAAVTAEVEAREAAVTAEAEAREAADTAEAEARKAADTQLRSDITEAMDIVSRNINSKHILGKTITPVYLGDYITNEQANSCCGHGDMIYTFNSNNYDSMGTIRVFNRRQNTKVRELASNVGHAQSAAYNAKNGYIYISPFKEYSAGQTLDASYILKYNPSFSSRVVIQAPRPMLSISYDPVTEIMYGLAYAPEDTEATLLQLYKIENDAFEFYAPFTIDKPIKEYANNELWQDAAVYNNMMVFTSFTGDAYVYDISDPENIALTDTARILSTDINNCWKFGEVEGIEFTTEGELLNIRDTSFNVTNPGDREAQRMCTVTSLNTAAYNAYNPIWETMPKINLNISDSYASKFRLGRTQIRTLSQLRCRIDNFSAVVVDANDTYTDNRVIVESNDFKLLINGTVDVGQIVLLRGYFLVEIGSSGTFKIRNTNGDNFGISATRYPASFGFRNNGKLTIPSGVELFHSGAVPSLAQISALGNVSTVFINGKNVPPYKLMMGSTIMESS